MKKQHHKERHSPCYHSAKVERDNHQDNDNCQHESRKREREEEEERGKHRNSKMRSSSKSKSKSDKRKSSKRKRKSRRKEIGKDVKKKVKRRRKRKRYYHSDSSDDSSFSSSADSYNDSISSSDSSDGGNDGTSSRRDTNKRKRRKNHKEDFRRNESIIKDQDSNASKSDIIGRTITSESVASTDTTTICSQNNQLKEQKNEQSAANASHKEVRRKQMVPMRKEEYEAQQKVIREVYDPDTGRYRLVRGTGEIIERIVSRQDHERINKIATRGDGLSYTKNLRGAFSSNDTSRR